MRDVHTPPVEFWVNIWGVDHLYPQCPAYQRAGNKTQGAYLFRFHLPDPNGDVCGWCTRLWMSRHADATPCPGPHKCRLIHLRGDAA